MQLLVVKHATVASSSTCLSSHFTMPTRSSNTSGKENRRSVLYETRDRCREPSAARTGENAERLFHLSLDVSRLINRAAQLPMPLGSEMQSVNMMSINSRRSNICHVISLASSVQCIAFTNFQNWPWPGNILKGRRRTLGLETSISYWVLTSLVASSADKVVKGSVSCWQTKLSSARQDE